MRDHDARVAVVALLVSGGWVGAACTPDIGNDPVPAVMQFDTAAVPPRVPQPIGLIINPQTGLIDFRLTGLTLPANCADAAPPLTQAECEFDQYLQTLDGFPTVTPAQAPASAPLDVATLAVGSNVVVVAGKSGTSVTEVIAGFDTTSRSLTVRPRRSWAIGESYWVGVRGYANGVRAETESDDGTSDGRLVVGSPTQALLKQTTPLTCDVLDDHSARHHHPGLLGAAARRFGLDLRRQRGAVEHL